VQHLAISDGRLHPTIIPERKPANLTHGNDTVIYNLASTILEQEVQHEEDLQNLLEDLDLLVSRSLARRSRYRDASEIGVSPRQRGCLKNYGAGFQPLSSIASRYERLVYRLGYGFEGHRRPITHPTRLSSRGERWARCAATR
jgi:hypothetical protein